MTSTLFGAPRLGLARTGLAHADRHGLLWLARCALRIEDGALVAACADPHIGPGEYAIPLQSVSMVLLGPGSSVTHDVLRVLARQGTGLVAIGEGGVRVYSSPPWGAGRSAVARQHAMLWADPARRLAVARRMYAIRFGEVLPHRDLDVLRGIEGGRVKAAYQLHADRLGIRWHGRRYDRANPAAADVPNRAINHFAGFFESAAEVATYAVGAIPALGFIHEDASSSFSLDIADLYRTDTMVPAAFSVAKEIAEQPDLDARLEQLCRNKAVTLFKERKLIPKMIERIKTLLELDEPDTRADAKRS